MKKLVILFLVFSFLTACEKEQKLVVFDTKNISNTHSANIEVTIDKASGGDDISKKINTSIEKALIISIPNTEKALNLNDALQEFDNDYKTFKTKFEDENHVWELALETEVEYQSAEVITIAVSCYSDTGGAHGNDNIQLLNINPETGETYSFEDIISDKNGFEALAKTHFEKSLKSDNKDISNYFFGESFQLPENIGFSEEGLILLYNVYEIASYSEGYTEFVIPFEKLDSYLKIN